MMKNKKTFWCCGIRIKEGEKCSICGQRMEKELVQINQKNQRPLKIQAFKMR
jgi:hypothetical protein